MEKQNEDTLLKIRSSRACIRTGYRLMAGNFKRILRYSWVAALVVAAAGSLLTTFAVSQYPQLVISIATAQATAAWPAESQQTLLLLAIGSVTMFVLMPLFLSYGMSQLRSHKETGSIPYPTGMLSADRHMMWRMLKCWLSMALILGMAMLVTGGAGSLALVYLGKTAGLITCVLTTTVMLLLSLPLYYVAMKYVMDERKGFWGTLAEGYPTGCRHLGYVFVIALVDLLTALIAGFVTTMPSVILSTANLQAQIGVLNGDPSGMPGYMTWLMLIVFLIAQFIRAYILMSVAFPLYYMYGSIEKMKNEEFATALRVRM